MLWFTFYLEYCDGNSTFFTHTRPRSADQFLFKPKHGWILAKNFGCREIRAHGARTLTPSVNLFNGRRRARVKYCQSERPLRKSLYTYNIFSRRMRCRCCGEEPRSGPCLVVERMYQSLRSAPAHTLTEKSMTWTATSHAPNESSFT